LIIGYWNLFGACILVIGYFVEVKFIPMYIKIIKLDTVDSTNDYASRIALLGAKEITVIYANSQNSGKGRMGKAWVSVPGKGIYVSFLLRPQNSLKEIYYLPLISALATARFLDNILDLAHKGHNKNKNQKQSRVTIKLPNDIIVNGKKIAGILVEAKTTGDKPDFVVIGIGLNVNSQKQELPRTATSLLLETKQRYDTEKIFPKLIKEIISVYADFKKGKINTLLEEVLAYQHGSCVEEIVKIFNKKKETEEVVHFV
jgi:BirA family biotin operon repressor/biotin-[acetyl-CoA-carboxylase] ligase